MITVEEIKEVLNEHGGARQLKRGLCPSCLGSGYVHETRGGVLGVVTTQGGLLRCDCTGRSYSTRQAEAEALGRI